VHSNKNIAGENFHMSQFWYDEQTTNLFVDELIDLAKQLIPSSSSSSSSSHDQQAAPAAVSVCNICCISVPSVFYRLQNRIHELPSNVKLTTLLEYDRRFDRDFPLHYVQYDYNKPTALPSIHFNNYDIMIADPPYLSDECMTSVGITMRLLARNKETRMIVNTGAVLRDSVRRVLGLNACKFQPTHRVNIMNEFACFTNYESQRLGGWRNDEKEEEDEK